MESEKYEQISRVFEDMDVTIEFPEKSQNGKKLCREIREILLQEIKSSWSKPPRLCKEEKEGVYR